MNLNPQSETMVVIEPDRSWRSLDFESLWRYRDLLFFLVWRDIKARYAQSILGIGWAILQPVASTVVFTIIFGRVAGISSDGVPYPLFSYVGLLAWTYFSGTLTGSASSLVQNAHMLQKIYFPRLLLPLSSPFTKLLDFSIAAALLVPMMVYYEVRLTPQVLMVPVLVVIMAMAAVGLGTFLTALAIQYRDVNHGMSFAVQLLMYAAPVVYPASVVPEGFRLLYAINPMVGVIEGLRSSLLGATAMPWDLIAVSAVGALASVVFGVLYFRSRESYFADMA